MLQSCELTQSHRSHQLLCRLRVPLAAARSFCVRRTRKDTHMFPYIASTLLHRLHCRETQPALLSTAALSRQVESKLLDRAGSSSGHIQITVPGRWSAGALELRSSVSYATGHTLRTYASSGPRPPTPPTHHPDAGRALQSPGITQGVKREGKGKGEPASC